MFGGISSNWYLFSNFFKTFFKKMIILDGTSYIAIFKYIFFLMTAVAQIYMMCLYGNKIIESVRKVIENISFFCCLRHFFYRALEFLIQYMNKTGSMLRFVIKNY